MALNLVNDLGAPGLVTVAMIVTRPNPASTTPPATVFGQPLQDAVAYGLASAGYLLPMIGFGRKYEELIKNIGIAALPIALTKVYDKFKGANTSVMTRAPISMRRVSRYPAPASESPFQGVRLV